MKVEHGQEPVGEPTAKEKPRKPAGGQIEASAQHTATLIERDSRCVHRKWAAGALSEAYTPT
jgi:hypothetical protein